MHICFCFFGPKSGVEKLCVWYIWEVFRDPPPVFPLPPPGGARKVRDPVRALACAPALLNCPAAQARRPLLCPSVVESGRFQNILRHYYQCNHQNRAKSPLERNIIFILLRSSLHGFNPTPISPAKHDAHLRRRFFRSRRCQVVN